MSTQFSISDPRNYDARSSGVFDARTYARPIREIQYNPTDSPLSSSSGTDSLCKNPSSSAGLRSDTGEHHTGPDWLPPSLAPGTSCIRFPRPTALDHYTAGTHSYQQYQRLIPLFERAEFSLKDTKDQPKTLQPTLPPLAFETVHQRSSEFMRPLPESLPKVLDVTRKPKAALQDTRMKKSESESKSEALETGWCSMHNAFDACDALPVKTPFKEDVKRMVSTPRPSVSTSIISIASSSSKATTSVTDEAGSKISKTNLGECRTNPKHSLDFVERQRISRASHLQHNMKLQEESFRKQAEQRKECERLQEEAKKLEVQWRSEVDRVSKDLKNIGKRVQANSKILICNSMVESKMAPQKSILESPMVNNSKTVAKKPDVPGVLKSVVTEYSEAAAARYWEKPESVSELAIARVWNQYPPGFGAKEDNLFRRSHGLLLSCRTKDIGKTVTADISCTDGYQAAEAERSTSRACVIGARLKSLAVEADTDGRWINVDLSDDEDWEKVVNEGSGEWELLDE